MFFVKLVLIFFVRFFVFCVSGFPTGVANMGGQAPPPIDPQNLMGGGGGLSQNMGGAWGSLKYCRKIPLKEFI